MAKRNKTMHLEIMGAQAKEREEETLSTWSLS
jgi:hypothetical protein